MNDDPHPRRLVLLRHAKAAAAGPDDHARELTPGGLDDAAEAGRWLADHDLVPTHALVSSAERTTQTWRAVADASGSSATASYDDALYSAGPDAMLQVLREADAGAGTLLLVGHNPTVAYVAQLLSDGLGDADALRESAQGYPPCALTVLEVTGTWSQLEEGSARVTGFHVGQA